jgi:hypothetical protein
MFKKLLPFLEEPRTGIVTKDVPGNKTLLVDPNCFDDTELF